MPGGEAGRAKDDRDVFGVAVAPVLASWATDRYHVCMARVVEWDGKNVPDEMRSLPPGRYVVEPIDEDISLTSDEEEGIRQAMASLEAGQGRSLEAVRNRVLSALQR